MRLIPKEQAYQYQMFWITQADQREVKVVLDIKRPAHQINLDEQVIYKSRR